MADFADSNFRFTSPVRFFKANDPIYYEVDNIPLKQLHENDLWLKDQIQKLANPGVNTEGEINRTLFSELKPYSDGTNNIVRVKPGKFTARINDAYSITPLQYIENITGSSVREYDTWTAKSAADPLVSGVMERFKSTVLADALNMNGLTERAFSYPAVTPNRANAFLSPSAPVIFPVAPGIQDNIQQPLYPLRDNQLLYKFTRLSDGQSLSNFVIKQYDTETVTVGFAALSTAEPEFIKRWRGVARTSVVDVADELSIEIPAFNPNDFYYINENNQKINLTNATQRIDLLFIYAKPVDADSTTIAKYVSTGQPTTITAPALGIVYGAGVGMNFRSATREFKNIVSGAVLTDSNVGSLKMLPHIGDQAGQSSGFKIGNTLVKGSFPSPDDLMNLTPILDEQLATNHYGLIGQSILPIAYIVVRKAASINPNQVNIVNNSDIIDIRPFFRTTELSYNERAGLAAAVPAPSLANPIVTQAELKYEINRALDRVYSNPPTPTTPTGTGTAASLGNVVLGMGYVFGGLKYGPEGVFANKLASTNQGDSETEIEAKVKQTCSIPSAVTIPILPDWDKALWLEDVAGAVADKVNDRINLFTAYARDAETGGGTTGRWYSLGGRANQLTKYTNSNAYPYVYNTARNSTVEWNNGNGWARNERLIIPPASNNKGIANNFWFVRKKFNITLPEGISDYFVDVKLFNCLQNVLIGVGGWDDLTPSENFTSNSIWVEKGVDDTNQKYFTINVAFSMRPIGDRDNSQYNQQNDRFGAEYNFWSYNYLLNSIGAQLDGTEITSDGPKDNSITKVYGRGGHRPKSVRDVGELTANWLATSELIIRENYIDKTNRGACAMGVCNYPSVMFSITGIRSSTIINTLPNSNNAVIDFGNTTQ